MKKIAVIISFIALALCAVVPFLSFFGVINFDSYLLWFNIASLFWFLSAPFWMVSGKAEE